MNVAIRETTAAERTQVPLRVTEIGEFVRFASCERRFRLGLDNSAEAKLLPFSERLFNPLDPVLQEAGRVAEHRWAESLRVAGLQDMTSDVPVQPNGGRSIALAEFASLVATLPTGTPAFGREIEIQARLGAFQVQGRVDFLVVLWDGERPRLLVVETKASRKDKTYQRVQLAAYALIFRNLLPEQPIIVGGQTLTYDSLSFVVARIDEATNAPQSILALPPLDLSIEMDDVERLLADDGLFARLADPSVSLDEIDYRIDSKCDDCKFNVHCLPESARQRRLELLGLAPTLNAILRANGVSTIDDLASVELGSPVADAIRRADGFNAHLGQLIEQARARRSTLPRGEGDPDNYQVVPLPHSGQSQLPMHEQNGQRLVRVYLEVNYDYVENRVGALAAHVTASDLEIVTPFDPETRRPAATCVEGRPIPREERDPATRERYAETREIQGRTIIHFQPQPWTGSNQEDTGAERQMLQAFFWELVDSIAEHAGGAASVPVHFYVYSRGEMAQLIEACTRTGSNLLAHLRELLGCREGLEQMIFSCLQDEVSNRFALGWTGRGLSVATSLSWFGQRYHWTRRVAGVEVQLDRVFEQDIFDFKSTLEIAPDYSWAREGEGAARRRYEIRSRFHDTLKAPYWRAIWGTLPQADDPEILDGRTRAAIQRYYRAAQPGFLRAYLGARVHALRWLDERVVYKNPDIEKPPLSVASLRTFTLGIDNAGAAALDFLMLDHHVKVTDWIATHMQPPSTRVQSGRTIPVRNIRVVPDPGNPNRCQILAEFDLQPYGLTPAEMKLRSSIGGFVRLAPRSADPEHGQTLRQLIPGGTTCFVVEEDWDNGTIRLSPIPNYDNSRYVVRSAAWKLSEGPRFSIGTLDESVSDFVAGHVEARLRSGRGRHVYDWFDPISPRVPPLQPPNPALLVEAEQILTGWQLPVVNQPLSPDQRRAVLDGLQTRVQLLKGPPGTGKTATTAASILSRCAYSHQPGQVLVIAANTHRAVDTLVRRLVEYRESFRSALAVQGRQLPPIEIARLPNDGEPLPAGVNAIRPEGCYQEIQRWRRSAIVVIAGTTAAVLKMVERGLNSKSAYANTREGFQADALVVDEASMMVFPHFLSLATLVRPDGVIMLAGDNLQLAPIIAHDWEREDRPPAQHYQPFKSSYEAVLRVIQASGLGDTSVRQSSLTYTYRLPAVVRRLIGRIYWEHDGIELEGRDDPPVEAGPISSLSGIWTGGHGLYLVVHTQRGSRQSNTFEASLVHRILQEGGEHASDSIAIITPHRAQRAYLQGSVGAEFGHAASIIDTVERLQGGERQTIIVCGTESDPHAIGQAADFILNLNRANVAFSRTQGRLVVVCAESLLDHIPPDTEEYASAVLWKSLRALCRNELFATEIDGFRVRVLGPTPALIDDLRD